MVSKNFSKLSIVLFFFLSSPLGFADKNKITNIPESFRDLWGEQDGFLEVRFYGQSLGVHRIKLTPTTVAFESPDSLLDKIEINKEKEADLRVLMRGSFQRNGNMSCQGYTGQNNCNYIKTNTVAVIVDDVENVLNLFIGNEFLASGENDSDYYQPSKNTKKAFIHSQTINLSDTGNYENLSIVGTGSLGITDNSYAILGWAANYNRYKSYNYNEQSINSLYFRHDFEKNFYYQLGRIDRTDLSQSSGGNFNFDLLPVPDIYGMRAGTTQSYIKNTGKSVASPVTIMLTHFSRVEAYRNGQLLGVWYLDAGISELDTERLPDGNYDLKLKIFEQEQLVREEIVPFNKSGSSIGDTHWDVFVQAGDIINDNGRYVEKQKNHKSAINSGLRLPLTRNLAVQLGGAVIDNKNYYETGILWNSGFLDGSLNSKFTFLFGDDTHGNYQNVSYTDGFNLSFYHNDKRVNDCGKDYNMGWSGCYESYSASLSIPVKGWNSTLAYSNTYSTSVYRYDAVSEYVPYFYYKGRTKRWQLTASTVVRWGDYNIMPTIGVYNSEQKQWADKGGYLSLTLTRVDGGKSLNAGYSYNYSRGNYTSNDAFVEGRLVSDTNVSYRELSARVSGNRYYTEGGVSGRINNRFGDLNGTLSVNKNRKSHDTTHSLTAGYSSSFALTTDGIYWGGSASGLTNLSGGIVRVKSNEDESELLNVKGSSYGNYSLGSNDSLFIPVPALMQASLTIKENTNKSKNIDVLAPTKNTFFMLPGSVYPIDVSANVSFTYVGRGVDVKGRPLSGAYILNAQNIVLDENGGFSFESSENEKELFLLKDKTIYSCSLDRSEMRNGIVFVGEVACNSTIKELLPEKLVTNSRIHDLLAYNQDTE